MYMQKNMYIMDVKQYKHVYFSSGSLEELLTLKVR